MGGLKAAYPFLFRILNNVYNEGEVNMNIEIILALIMTFIVAIGVIFGTVITVKHLCLLLRSRCPAWRIEKKYQKNFKHKY